MKRSSGEYPPESALEDVAHARSSSRKAHQYSVAAPYLELAGGLWLLSNITLQFTGLNVWGLAAPLSLPLFGLILFIQSRRRSGGWDTRSRRALGVWMILALFVGGSLLVFSPSGFTATHSFLGLLAGAGFGAVGIFSGWRLVLVGTVIMVLSIVAFLWFDSYYPAFMGVVGGGGMIVGARWLRRI